MKPMAFLEVIFHENQILGYTSTLIFILFSYRANLPRNLDF